MHHFPKLFCSEISNPITVCSMNTEISLTTWGLSFRKKIIQNIIWTFIVNWSRQLTIISVGPICRRLRQKWIFRQIRKYRHSGTTELHRQWLLFCKDRPNRELDGEKVQFSLRISKKYPYQWYPATIVRMNHYYVILDALPAVDQTIVRLFQHIVWMARSSDEKIGTLIMLEKSETLWKSH